MLYAIPKRHLCGLGERANMFRDQSDCGYHGDLSCAPVVRRLP